LKRSAQFFAEPAPPNKPYLDSSPGQGVSIVPVDEGFER
jgi:hypothetical protein